jgi:hypothetical protein
MGCFCSHTTACADARARTHTHTHTHINTNSEQSAPHMHITEKRGGIIDGQNGTGIGIFVYFRHFLIQYHSTIASYLYFNLLTDHRLYVIIIILFIRIVY